MRVVAKHLDKDGKLKRHRSDIGITPYPETFLAEIHAKSTKLRLQIRSCIVSGIGILREQQISGRELLSVGCLEYFK